MNLEEVRQYALSLPGVAEDQPFGDDIVTYRVEGKIFLCLWLGEEPRFACKLTPERNDELRERHCSIKPAYHWNKKHWSDVYFRHLGSDFVAALIRESHSLVVSKLPKALRDNII